MSEGKPSQYMIADERREKFIMIPNIIDEMNLSPFAFRLYAHFKRVAGDDGVCYQSGETLSKACNMSTGMISKAKQELKDAGLIRITTKATDRNIYHEITIVDVWGKNSQGYSVSPHEGVSYSEEPPSPHEKLPSPHETINIPINNIPSSDKKSDSELDMTVTPGGRKLHALLEQENRAKGHRTSSRFKTLAMRDKWLLECEGRLAEDELDKAMRKALSSGITALPNIINYVSAWNTKPRAKYNTNGSAPTAAQRPAVHQGTDKGLDL